MSTTHTFLRRQTVERRTGLKRSTIYKHMQDGTFPQPIRIGPRAVAWLETDIEQWQAEQIAATRSAV